MYLSLICAGVLLLEAVSLYYLLRREPSRWLALVPLALVVPALTLAGHAWDIYARNTLAPHFPPGWVIYGGAPPDGDGLLAFALYFVAATIALFTLFAFSANRSTRELRMRSPLS